MHHEALIGASVSVCVQKGDMSHAQYIIQVSVIHGEDSLSVKFSASRLSGICVGTSDKSTLLSIALLGSCFGHHQEIVKSVKA